MFKNSPCKLTPLHHVAPLLFSDSICIIRNVLAGIYFCVNFHIEIAGLKSHSAEATSRYLTRVGVIDTESV